MKTRNYTLLICFALVLHIITLLSFAEPQTTSQSVVPDEIPQYSETGEPALVVDESTILFDLAAGNVTINASTYSGYIYVDGVQTVVAGTHTSANKYYIYQSNPSNTTLQYDEYGIPIYNRVERNDVSWGDFISNNTNIPSIISAWTTAAQAVGRKATANYITLSGSGTYDVTVDNIWSSYSNSSTARIVSGIGFSTTQGKLLLRLRGDNRFAAIHINSNSTGRTTFQNDSGTALPATLTVASYNGKDNHYNSVIGGNDNSQSNAYITINGGIIYAGAQRGDNCSGIGGGGNGVGGVTINGGRVTSVVHSSGSAIGGGIGESSVGGNANVKITGGVTYAYNYGYCSSMSGKSYYIAGAAIGGGSSCKSTGNQSTVIYISGGYVYAQSLGGAAIGGGSSTMSSGGGANITISGQAIVEAQSVGGTATNGEIVPPGVSIGGGTGGPAGTSNGGNITLNINGGYIYTGSIGGGECANSVGQIGSGTVTMTDGTLRGQIVMGAGASSQNTFKMNGGIIDGSLEPIIDTSYQFAYLENNGGAVHLQDGIVTMQNGTIKNYSANLGGAIYIEGSGRMEMRGGIIENCTSTSGGAVYIDNGNFAMLSGAVQNCTASENGGGIMLNAGEFTMSGGYINQNAATYGGGVYVAGGNILMENGTLDGNDAAQSGGAFYVYTNTIDVTINVQDGVITNNFAGNHAGAIGASAENDKKIALNIGLISCLGVDNTQHDDACCPVIRNNTATRLGGAICLHGNTNALTVNVYCGTIKDNTAIRNPGSNSLNQSGGTTNVLGGDIDPGLMIGGGIYDDNRPGAEELQMTIRLWSNYEGGPTEPVLVEVTLGVTMVFPMDTYEWEGHELTGWTTSPDTSGMYIPGQGQYAIPYNETGYLDFYAAWDLETSYMVYIPDTVPLNSAGTGEINISADCNWFKAISSLNIYVFSDFLLSNEDESEHIPYNMSSSEFGKQHLLGNGDLAATYQYNNTMDKVLSITLQYLPIYAGEYTDTITFEIEYTETEPYGG